MTTLRAPLVAFSLSISALLSLHCSRENPAGTSSTSSSSSSGSTEAGGNGGTGGNGPGGNGVGGNGTGGMGTGGTGGTGSMIQPEGMAVVFPPLAALTPADKLSARGTTDASFGITGVTVGSVAATSSDSFATWQAADVPLVFGAQSLAVNPTGSLLAMHPPLRVERNDVVEAPEDLVFDAANNRVFTMSSYGWTRFYSIDLDTGKATRFSTPDITDGMTTCIVAGNPFERSIAYDPGADELLAISGQCIVRINVQTGVRAVLTNTLPQSLGQQAMAVDSAKGRIIVLGYRALYAVDLASGMFTVISDMTTGTGPTLDATSTMALDLANNRALVLQGNGSTDFALVAVDLSSGNRTVLSSATMGSGPSAYSPEGATYDPTKNRTITGDSTRVIAIDNATGNRTILSDQTNTGPAINTPTGFAFDSAKGRIIETDLDSHILAINPTTGDRSTLYDYAVGTGPAVRVAYLTADPVTGDLYAAPLGQEILHVDRSGNRTVLSGSGTVPVGTGPALYQLRGMYVYRPNDELVVIARTGMTNNVLSVDRSTGNRTIISGGTVGSGPAFMAPSEVVVHPSGNPIWVIDAFASAIFQVDRSTGDRTIIADNTAIGTGPAFGVSSLSYDGTSLIVLGQGTVLAVDPATGNRTVVSGPTVGMGPQMTGSFLTVNPAGTTIYSVFSGRVLAIDRATGDRTMLANTNVGRGPLVSYGFVHAGPNGIVWLSGDPGYSIGALDTVTGDRVIVAK
ncbi:MAG TPA: PQQ-binding-like beta-propeller repeat protein [Polyangium sp.]|nr:PQQ-binding-like beta-propeller repeat protein [Polyangium sp.]